MTEVVLTADRILDAAEDCLRRYGPQKTTVVDVARSLSVSHGAIYRHYASKEALREAVVGRWLERDVAELQAVASSPGDAAERLRAWLGHLIESKRKKVLDDPEMFATHCELVKDMRNLRELIDQVLGTLQAQLADIIRSGVKSGQFAVADPVRAAGAVFHATLAFHHPMLVKMHSECQYSLDLEAAYQDVLQLLLAGLGWRP